MDRFDFYCEFFAHTLVEIVKGMWIDFRGVDKGCLAKDSQVLRNCGRCKGYFFGEDMEWSDTIFQEMSEDDDSGGMG